MESRIYWLRLGYEFSLGLVGGRSMAKVVDSRQIQCQASAVRITSLVSIDREGVWTGMATNRLCGTLSPQVLGAEKRAGLMHFDSA